METTNRETSDGQLEANKPKTVEYRFVIPTLPPSANALHDIIYSRRQVVLKPSVLKWKSDAKLFIPRITLSGNTLIEIRATFHYGHYHANGKLRRFDTQNLLKCLIDTIANKVGFDDSRVKEGSWASVDSKDEKVEVVLSEYATCVSATTGEL